MIESGTQGNWSADQQESFVNMVNDLRRAGVHLNMHLPPPSREAEQVQTDAAAAVNFAISGLAERSAENPQIHLKLLVAFITDSKNNDKTISAEDIRTSFKNPQIDTAAGTCRVLLECWSEFVTDMDNLVKRYMWDGGLGVVDLGSGTEGARLRTILASAKSAIAEYQADPDGAEAASEDTSLNDEHHQQLGAAAADGMIEMLNLLGITIDKPEYRSDPTEMDEATLAKKLEYEERNATKYDMVVLIRRFNHLRHMPENADADPIDLMCVCIAELTAMKENVLLDDDEYFHNGIEGNMDDYRKELRYTVKLVLYLAQFRAGGKLPKDLAVIGQLDEALDRYENAKQKLHELEINNDVLVGSKENQADKTAKGQIDALLANPDYYEWIDLTSQVISKAPITDGKRILAGIGVHAKRTGSQHTKDERDQWIALLRDVRRLNMRHSGVEATQRNIGVIERTLKACQDVYVDEPTTRAVDLENDLNRILWPANNKSGTQRFKNDLKPAGCPTEPGTTEFRFKMPGYIDGDVRKALTDLIIWSESDKHARSAAAFAQNTATQFKFVRERVKPQVQMVGMFSGKPKKTIFRRRPRYVRAGPEHTRISVRISQSRKGGGRQPVMPSAFIADLTQESLEKMPKPVAEAWKTLARAQRKPSRAT